nr:hypothetical protein [Candidatus Aenigmarchaeota archaeon]
SRYLRRIPAKYILFLFIFGTVFSVFGTLSGIEFGKRIESILTFYKEGAWIIRMAVWGASLKMLFDSYGLGVGLGGVEALFSKVFHHPFPVGSVPPHAHSLYFDVLSHFGLIGFSLFLILVIRLVQYLYRSQRKIGRSALGEMLWALCCGLVSVGVQLIITGLLHVSELWIYMGMTIACAKIGEKELNLKGKIN